MFEINCFIIIRFKLKEQHSHPPGSNGKCHKARKMILNDTTKCKHHLLLILPLIRHII